MRHLPAPGVCIRHLLWVRPAREPSCQRGSRCARTVWRHAWESCSGKHWRALGKHGFGRSGRLSQAKKSVKEGAVAGGACREKQQQGEEEKARHVPAVGGAWPSCGRGGRQGRLCSFDALSPNQTLESRSQHLRVKKDLGVTERSGL